MYIGFALWQGIGQVSELVRGLADKIGTETKPIRMVRFLAKVIVIATMVFAAAWLTYGLLAPAGSGEEKLVQPKPGSSAHRIASALETAGGIRSQRMFLLWHALHGRKPLKAGEYAFDHPARMVVVYDR